MSPLIHPDVWLNSQLSIARHYGGITVDGYQYLVDYKTGCLIRSDFCGVVGALGIETVKKALERYEKDWYARKVCQRLARIVKARRKASICNDAVLF